MPAKDIYHNIVKEALTKDGWTITHDPLRLKWGGKTQYVDLGAERLLGATRNQQNIAVEIKSFVSDSEMHDLQQALGQFTLYKVLLNKLEPNRQLYLAVTEEIAKAVFDEPIGQLVIAEERVKIVSFSVKTKEVIRWIE
jgi:hypothetical protein